MPAYMIATRTSPVRDAAALAEYSRLNQENAASFVAEFSARPLVVYGTLEAQEGPAPDGIVILQFPSMEIAKAWYASPAYQHSVPYRQKAADYTVVLVEGL